MRWTAHLLCLGVLLGVLAQCKPSSKSNSTPAANEALKIFVWEDSIPDEVLRDFERESGITVRADYYSQLDTLVDRVRQDPARYDVIAPSDYILKALSEKQLLMPLPDAANSLRQRLGDRFRKPWYDPELQYGIPFQWSVSGLAYNKKHVRHAPQRWADFLDPGRANEWAGRISLLNDAREALGISLLANGKSPLATEAAALEAAGDRLKRMVPLIARFDSEHFEDGLANGSLWIVHGFNGDLARAKRHNPDIEYVIPEEGAIMSVDNLAIPAGSAHSALAVRFMEFILRPETARRLVVRQGFGCTLAGGTGTSEPLPLSEEIVFGMPSPDRTFSLKESGPEKVVVDRLWKSVQTF